MLKRFIPFAYEKAIFDIDIMDLSSLGIKTILTDLDNTLITYDDSTPTPKVKELKRKLDEAGIKIIICSNNKGKRVSRFSNLLGVEYESFLRKPFSGPLKKMIKRKGLNKKETIIIGDQIMTDVLCGNASKIRVILTEPLGKKEPPWTKVNRLFDKPIRKRMLKKGLLKSLKEKINGEI